MKDFFLKQEILALRTSSKTAIIFLTDFFIFLISGYLALVVENGRLFYPELFEVLKVSWLPVLGIIILVFLGAYKSIIRFIDFSAIFRITRGLVLLMILSSLIIFGGFGFKEFYGAVSLDSWIMGWLFSVILIIGSRLMAHVYFSEVIVDSRVIIYGAGSAGIQLATALKVSQEMQPIAFVDRDKSLHNSYVGGLKILPPSALEKLVRKKKVDEVLIAIPSASKSVLRSLLSEVEDYSIKVRILPGLAELAQGKVVVSELKEVDISDLLGRFEVDASQELLNKNVKEKIVLVTGAGGSIGSEISRQVAKIGPKKIILLDSNEYSLYAIKQDLELNFSETDAYSILGSVTNSKKMDDICKIFNIDTIYHAAAYKHVPLV